MRFSYPGTVPLLVGGVLAALCLAAAPQDAPPSRPDKGLVVHEWGTFSTFSGSDGTNLEFQPYDNDLPDFVHGYLPRNSKSGPAGGTISLETPVLYFYSEHALTASVQVDFPKGVLTEWYPHAERTEKKLLWQGVKVLPNDDVDLPNEKKQSRYYRARETDAAPLRAPFKPEDVSDAEQEKFLFSLKHGADAQGALRTSTAEQEKFLFYRGVGTFDMPLSVQARGDGKFTAAWNGSGPWGDLILVQVKAGKVRFQPFHLEPKKCGGQAEVRVPDRDATEDQLGEAVVKLLLDKGLYEKEARAMVKTWSAAWFGEEGTRVLYVLPQGLTDDLLPLRVEPKPDALLRVLVGRHDVLTPEREKQIDANVAELERATSEQDARQRAASEEMAKLGRYSGAAWTAAGERLKTQR